MKPPRLQSFNVTQTFLSLLVLLTVSAATAAAVAQENTSGDSSTPLVYSMANTGANYPAPTFPSFAQLPIIRPLPDPFVFADGTRDTSFSSWEKRRNEIKAAIEKYEIGPVPDCSDCTITANYVPPVAGSSTGTLTVNVTRNAKTLTLTSGVYIPQGMGSGPFPAVIPMEIHLCFGTFCFGPPSQPDYGSLPKSVFQGLPIATVGYVSTQVAAYNFSSPSNHTSDPFYQLYPNLCEGICSGGSNHGEYAAWSWGLSRLVDGMEIATHQAMNPLPVDMTHLAVTGCSFAGKMALFAGAFDERIALTIAQENGGGGAPSWRVSHEIEADTSVEDIHDTNYDWFAGQMHQFTEDASYKEPVDHHELMAMVAPRALLETGNTDFYWLSNRSNYISARATQRIYNTFGIGDRFGFYIDGGHNHCATLPAEAPAISAFVSKFLLGNATTNTDVEVYPTNPPLTYDYTNLDYSRWTAWWGTGNPTFPNDWNPGDGSIVTSMTRPLDINGGDAVLAGYDLYMAGAHPAANVSLTGANVQTDVSCPDGSSYTLRVPLPSASFSIAAGDNSWLPSPVQKSPLVYQGSTTASGCSGGHATSAYFSALGLNNGVGNPPLAPGFSSTDTTDPLNVRYHCSDSTSGDGGSWSPTVTVNY
ncbi:MAG TPA: hypothetical protein VGS02_01245 [Acidobacteriaceae bacterium]|nr:hypothetical protein [Acidobacteriaceae bacterium]